jgi:hypothetical protein
VDVQARQFAIFVCCVVAAALLALAPAVLANRNNDNGKRAGSKTVVATWKTDAPGTGSFVRITRTEPRRQGLEGLPRRP